MPNNWKTYKLSDALEIKYGKDHKKVLDGNIPIYGTGGIMRYGNQALYDKETILIPRKGSLNNIFYLNEPFWSVDTIFWSKINEEVAFPKYLFYNLKVLDFASMDVGSAIPSLTTELLKKIEIELPSLEEQKSIASILSTIDDKIENNLAINKTLEEMAMALYKHWFVDFGPFQDGEFVESELGRIPKGWEIKIFSDLYEVKKGLSYKSKFYSDKGIPMINLKCVDRNGGFRYDGVKYYDGDYKRQHVVLPGDLLVAMTDLTQDRTVLGSPLIAPDLNTSSDVIASLDISILKQIQSETSHLNLFFYYQMRTHKYHEYILGYGNGSTVMHLDKKGLLDYTCFLPSNDVLEKFNELVSNLRNRIELNIKENQTLTQLRDTLLPKLISGEVRLKEFRESITN